MKKTIYIPDDLAKELNEDNINLSKFVQESYKDRKKSSFIVKNSIINWDDVREDKVNSCLYLVRVDGLSDYERLNIKRFRTPLECSKYYNSLVLSEKTSQGKGLLALSRRKTALLEYIKNGVKFHYLPSKFIQNFEKGLK